MNDDLLNQKTNEAMRNLGVAEVPVELTESEKLSIQIQMSMEKAKEETDSLTQEQRDRIRRMEQMEFNSRVDYAKAYKKNKNDEEKVRNYKAAVVEELITEWAQTSMAARFPGVLLSGYILHVADFFKTNVDNVPYFPDYASMTNWIQDVANHLHRLDKTVFDYCRSFLESTTTKYYASEVQAGQIGDTNKLLKAFDRDSMFFMGMNVWPQVFVLNENVTTDPAFKIEQEHSELLKGKLGSFKGAGLFTDGFRAPLAKCLDPNEGFFLSTPLIKTINQPVFRVVVNVDNVRLDGTVDVVPTHDFYRSLKVLVTEGEEFVKQNMKHVVIETRDTKIQLP